ncbi:MAG: ubiquinol-cytochrome C chaperone family protein [Fimbriimonas sp.]
MTTKHVDPELMAVLAPAEHEDLAILIDIITSNGEGRISLASEVCEALVNAKKSGEIPPSARTLIAEEIQKFGGNSLVNLFRGGAGVRFKETVCDVADHVNANYNEEQDVAQIESSILLKIVEKSLEKMTEEEKKKFFEEFGVNYQGGGPASMAALIAAIRLSGFAAYKLTTIVAQAVAKAIVGRGLSFGATAGLMRGVSVFAGPIGWAITGIWTAFDLASPAYRVTVPCVIQIAYMRQKAQSIQCPACSAPATKGAKFCSECGHSLTPTA